MLKTEYSLFLGKTSDSYFSGFITEKGLYLVIEMEDTTIEKGTLFLNLIKESIQTVRFTSLSSFEAIISESIQKANLPLGVSLAAFYINDNTAFLKTFGEGKIFLKRDKTFINLIQGNNDASGHVLKNDLYLLSTNRFLALFDSHEQLNNIVLSTDVYSVVDTIYEHINDKDDAGITSLFISPLDESESSLVSEGNQEVIVEEGESTSLMQARKNPSFNLSFINVLRLKTKKTFTTIIVLVIFGALIWSVILGYQRRVAEAETKKVTAAKESINSKLSEAESVYSSNTPQAVELVKEARKELDILKEELGEHKQKEINELSQLIANKEDKIINKGTKKAEEFYDLEVDSKGATAQILSVEGDDVILLDKSKKTIYILSLDKKSLLKRVANEVAQSSLIGFYQGNIYLFIQDEGVFTLSGDRKVKKIIEADKDWGKITDMKIYSGNVYLLDGSNNEIQKYLVTEDGYSAKQPYFKAEHDITTAKSFAIDSTVYVGLPDKILKFNGGVPTDFITTYPDSISEIHKVFANESLEYLYVWDKDKGAVYILEKAGTYKQTLKADIMTKATDFIATTDGIFFLLGSKIYKVSTDLD